MGKKPPELESFTFYPPIEFNGEKISFVQADLIHINHGKSRKTKRSNFSLREIEEIIRRNLNGLDLDPVNEDNSHFYFTLELELKEKVYRLIFCSDKLDFSLGIITFYRIG